jgi:hypothetical protein
MLLLLLLLGMSSETCSSSHRACVQTALCDALGEFEEDADVALADGGAFERGN